MPGIITHLACASRYLRGNQTKDFNQFILGTTFPDIRYIAKLERDLTHKKFRPNLNLSRLEPFEAGWKLHIYVDNQWNKFVRNSVFYERYADKFLASAAAKIIEDQLDHKKIADLARYLKAMISPELESVLGVSAEKIKFYYKISADYVVTKNYEVFARQVLEGRKVVKVFDQLKEMKKDKDMIKFLSSMVEKILP